jgi:hypothetical protein
VEEEAAMPHPKDQHFPVAQSGSRGGWSLMGRFMMWSMRNRRAR